LKIFNNKYCEVLYLHIENVRPKFLNNQLGILIVGRVLQIIIMVASIRILTTILSPEELGNYYLATAILTFFNLVLLNPPGMYFGRHLLHWQESKNLLNAIFLFILWMFAVAVVTIPLLFILFEYMGYADKFSFKLFLLFITLAMLISTTHRNVMYGTNTLGHKKEFVISLIATLILGLTVSSSLTYFYNATSLNWLFGIVVSEAMALYFIFRLFTLNNKLNIKKIKETIKKERIIKILKFCVPIAITTFFMWGQNLSYRFIVDYKYSAEMLAYIAVGFGISAAVFGSIESLVMQYFNPIFLKDILNTTKEQRAEAWNKMASYVVPIYILTTVFAVTMAELLITLLVDSKFHGAYYYVMLGALFEFFRVMTGLLNNVAQAEHKTAFTIKPYLVGFTVSIGLLVLCDFQERIIMVPVVMVIAYYLVFFIMHIQMKKLLNIKVTIVSKKLSLLIIPFSVIYFLPELISIYSNIFLLFIFSLYFLFANWLLIRKTPTNM